jgi:Protein of unknown function (DUF2865)
MSVVSKHSGCRPSSRAVALFAALLVWLCPAGPASAQGLLDLLFGGPKSAPVTGPATQRAATTSPQASSFSNDARRTANEAGPREGGTYRTVCVRMCDGYFTPMSYATTRNNFAQDQNKCRASCGDDARLFFYRNPGSTIDEATDLSGRPYARIPNAFRYRKALVDGCSCRPPPWSEASLARHRAYAEGPQSPIPAAKGGTIKVAEASKPPVVHNATPYPTDDQGPQSQAPYPEKTAKPEALDVGAPPTKSRTTQRRREPTANAPVKVARATPPQVVAAAPAPAGGLFGFSSGPSMGLGIKPKYTWPGDRP